TTCAVAPMPTDAPWRQRSLRSPMSSLAPLNSSRARPPACPSRWCAGLSISWATSTNRGRAASPARLPTISSRTAPRRRTTRDTAIQRRGYQPPPPPPPPPPPEDPPPLEPPEKELLLEELHELPPDDVDMGGVTAKRVLAIEWENVSIE